MRLALVVLLCLLAGCSIYTTPTPAYCDYPIVSATCHTSCNDLSGPGPTTICPTDDGTEWRVTSEGTADRVVHTKTEFYLVCEVSPRGELIYERLR